MRAQSSSSTAAHDDDGMEEVAVSVFTHLFGGSGRRSPVPMFEKNSVKILRCFVYCTDFSLGARRFWVRKANNTTPRTKYSNEYGVRSQSAFQTERNWWDEQTIHRIQ